jgi:uncharacterized protein DUF3631
MATRAKSAKAPAKRSNRVPAQRVTAMPSEPAGLLPILPDLIRKASEVQYSGSRITIDFPPGVEVSNLSLWAEGVITGQSAAPAAVCESLASVAADVRDFLREAIEFTHEGDAELVTVWCLMAHMFRELDAFGHLHITSAAADVGKSWLQALIVWLTGGRAFGATTASAFLRAVGPDGGRTVVGLDEIGRLFDTAGADRYLIEAIINGIHSYSAPGARVDASGDVVTFDVRFPVVLAGLAGKPLPFDVTTRLIDIEMTECPPERAREIKALRQGAGPGRAESLHKRMAAAVAEVHETLRSAALAPAVVHGEALTGRNDDIWSPLMGAAAVLGGGWPAALSAAAERRVMLEAPHQQSTAEKYVDGLWVAIRSGDLAPHAYQNPSAPPKLDGTTLTLFDVGFDSITRYSFKRVSVFVKPEDRIFELRWRADDTDDVVRRVCKAMGWSVAGAEFVKVLWKAGMLRTQAGRSSVMGRTFRTDKARQRTIVLSLGEDPRVSWTTDQVDPSTNPDGE